MASETGNPFADLVNKFGLPTAILVICGFFTYRDVVKPIAADYQKLLLEVRTNNTEIKGTLLQLGESNRQRISSLEDRILSNSEAIESGLTVLANENKEELVEIRSKIDELLAR